MMVPFLLAAILFSYFGLQRRPGNRGQGLNAEAKKAVVADEAISTEGWATSSRFRAAVVTLYIPLGIFVFVLLFPFYWMGTTAFKPNAELLSREGNPFWVAAPRSTTSRSSLFDTPYPEWMWNTVIVSVVSTLFSLAASVFAAYAIERLRFKGSKQTGC
jgi:multiple sugar transport system permease protein